jgi:mono/diheme cytochrome c family protein
MSGRPNLSNTNLLREREIRSMRPNRVKLLATLSFVLPVLAFSVVFRPTPAAATTATLDDAATVYKAKCAMCHTAKATKSYDPAMPLEQQVEAILKGKKAEKPPNMPAFESKGVTADDAKALAELMKGLATAP